MTEEPVAEDVQVVAASDTDVAAAVNEGAADPGPSSAVLYSDTNVIGLTNAPLSTFERVAASGVEPVIPEGMEDLVDKDRLNELAASVKDRLAARSGEGSAEEEAAETPAEEAAEGDAPAEPVV